MRSNTYINNNERHNGLININFANKGGLNDQ